MLSEVHFTWAAIKRRLFLIDCNVDDVVVVGCHRGWSGVVTSSSNSCPRLAWRMPHTEKRNATYMKQRATAERCKQVVCWCRRIRVRQSVAQRKQVLVGKCLAFVSPDIAVPSYKKSSVEQLAHLYSSIEVLTFRSQWLFLKKISYFGEV